MHDKTNDNVDDCTRLKESNRITAAFLIPLSPEHAAQLCDKYGAKNVTTYDDGFAFVTFNAPAMIAFIETFIKKVDEVESENPDTADNERMLIFMKKMGIPFGDYPFDKEV